MVTPPEVVVVVEDKVGLLLLLDEVPLVISAALPLTLLLDLDVKMGFIMATGVVVVVVSSSKDVTTELVIVTIVAAPLNVVVVEAGEMLFFLRTHARTFSLNSTGYVEHRIVASRSNIDWVVRSALGRCSNTKSKANWARDWRKLMKLKEN